MLFGVSGTDPIALSAAGAVLLGAALLASWIPARRAARVDPMVALRQE
jgi:ABC-type lipoprotein release transport system permease subunit